MSPNRPRFIPADDLEDAIVPWFRAEWCTLGGTATDHDAITLADWERGRAMRAMVLNPALNIDRMPEGSDKGTKRGRPKGSRRPTVTDENGVVRYRCSRCRKYKVKADFHGKREDADGIQSHCRRCGQRIAAGCAGGVKRVRRPGLL